MEKIVNAMGDACPIPVIKTKKAMQELGGAGTVKVLVDNETAVANLTKLGEENGGSVSAVKVEEKKYEVSIVITGECETAAAAPLAAPAGPAIVVLSSDKMGSGNDELGAVLVKGFVYALTQQDSLPKTILCYNGGATLTCEGSPALEDLKAMAAQGVEILTCGTCLNYYGIADKLAVGSVTNMYVIVQKMTEAGKIIKP